MTPDMASKIVEQIPWWGWLMGGGMGLSFLGMCILIIKTARSGSKTKPCIHSVEFQELANVATGGTGASYDNKETLAVLRDNLVKQTQILESVNKTNLSALALLSDVKTDVAVLRATQLTQGTTQVAHNRKMEAAR